MDQAEVNRRFWDAMKARGGEFSASDMRNVYRSIFTAEEWLSFHVERLAAETLQSDRLHSDDALRLPIALESFKRAFQLLTSDPDSQKIDRAVAYDAIGAAYDVAILCGGCDDDSVVRLGPEIRAGNTAAAIQANRHNSALINLIIDGLSQETWKKNSKLMGNKKSTATNIRAAVMGEIKRRFGDSPPSGWESADEKTEIDRIRKRVPDPPNVDE